MPHLFCLRLCLNLLIPLPLLKLSLSFLALKEFLYLWEQDSRQGLHFMERNAGAIVVGFLLCQILSSKFLIQNCEDTSPYPFVYLKTVNDVCLCG